MLRKVIEFMDRLVERTGDEVALYGDGQDDRQLIFKVVTVFYGTDGESERWSFYSGPYSIQYPPNEFVSSETPLLVFDTQASAADFLSINMGVERQDLAYRNEVWAAVGEGPSPMPYNDQLLTFLPDKTLANMKLMRLFWQSMLWTNYADGRTQYSGLTTAPVVAVFHPFNRDRYGGPVQVSEIGAAPEGTLAFNRVKLLRRVL